MEQNKASRPDYADLRDMIKAAGLLTQKPQYYVIRIGMHLLAYISLLALAIGVGHSWWSLLLAPPLAAVNLQLNLYVHDVAHNAAFSSRQWSRAYGLFVGTFLNGLGLGWWKQSHNSHHANTWHEDRDPDLLYPCFALTHKHAERIKPIFRPILRYQHLLLWPLMSLVGFNKKIRTAQWLAQRPQEYLEISAVVMGRLFHAAILFLLFDPVIGIVFGIVQTAIFGLILAIITATNHWGMPVRSDSANKDFLRDQVIGSRNILGGWLLRYAYAGLDMQIEHHLFPTMPRYNLKKAAAIVQPFCQTRGIPYEAVSLTNALRSVYLDFRRIARSASARAPQRMG